MLDIFTVTLVSELHVSRPATCNFQRPTSCASVSELRDQCNSFANTWMKVEFLTLSISCVIPCEDSTSWRKHYPEPTSVCCSLYTAGNGRSFAIDHRETGEHSQLVIAKRASIRNWSSAVLTHNSLCEVVLKLAISTVLAQWSDLYTGQCDGANTFAFPVH
jgi:hypothetical protein